MNDDLFDEEESKGNLQTWVTLKQELKMTLKQQEEV